ncbi:MAG: transcriptional repressor LexA [Pseudomonadota bacterium]
MKKLTPRQQEILDYIRTTINRTGMPPTRMDICDYFEFRSPTAAEDHLRALEKKGVLEIMSGTSRGLRIRNKKKTLGLPLVGRVAAGEPILAEEHIEDYFEVNANQFQPRAHYLLRVRGHSMRDVGILNNDLLAVHRTEEVRSGQIVVARLENDVTVKRFRRRGYQVTLHPENEDFEPIEVDLRDEEFAIEGLGVGVLRPKL